MIVWVIGMKGSPGPASKGDEGLAGVSLGDLPAGGRYGITPALGVLWTLLGCSLMCRRKESRKQIKTYF